MANVRFSVQVSLNIKFLRCASVAMCVNVDEVQSCQVGHGSPCRRALHTLSGSVGHKMSKPDVSNK